MKTRFFLLTVMAAVCAAAHAASYYVVVPFNKAQQIPSVPAPVISLTLASYTLPVGHQNKLYAGFDFKNLLSVSGDPQFNLADVSWSPGATLPSGFSLSQDGLLSGTPTQSGLLPVIVTATYKEKSTSSPYTVEVIPEIGISSLNGYHAWADGSYADSCKSYLTGGGDKAYTGDVGDGVYRIALGAGTRDVYCDMTRDGGGWTLIVKAISGTRSHANTAAVGTLTSPGQLTSAKLSDADINAIPKSAYRITSSTGSVSVYFDTSDVFAATRQVANKASKTISPAVWEGPFYDSNHRGFNTYQYLKGNFARSDSKGAVYTGGSATDTCRQGIGIAGMVAWCGAGDSGTVWLR